MNELSGQQKIELGKTIAEYVSFVAKFDNENFLDIAEITLDKIQVLTRESENNTEILQTTPSDDKGTHTCGVCFDDYSPDVLKKDFEICPGCRHLGKTKIECRDKNGKLFTSGDILKNENSTVTVQVLQVQENAIIYGKLGFILSKQDFVDAGWIVHERVTGYDLRENSLECLTTCKFEDPFIGSAACRDCNSNKGYDLEQQWVICELYNKE